MEISKKNNWWTSEKDKKNISPETQIEYILNSWKIENLKEILGNFWLKKIENIYKNRLKNNIYLNKKRHLLINFFFDANRK